MAAGVSIQATHHSRLPVALLLGCALRSPGSQPSSRLGTREMGTVSHLLSASPHCHGPCRWGKCHQTRGPGGTWGGLGESQRGTGRGVTRTTSLILRTMACEGSGCQQHQVQNVNLGNNRILNSYEDLRSLKIEQNKKATYHPYIRVRGRAMRQQLEGAYESGV